MTDNPIRPGALQSARSRRPVGCDRRSLTDPSAQPPKLTCRSSTWSPSRSNTCRISPSRTITVPLRDAIAVGRRSSPGPSPLRPKLPSREPDAPMRWTCAARRSNTSQVPPCNTASETDNTSSYSRVPGGAAVGCDPGGRAAELCSVASVLPTSDRESTLVRIISRTPHPRIAAATAPVATVIHVPGPFRGASGCRLTDPRKPGGKCSFYDGIHWVLRSSECSGGWKGSSHDQARSA